MSSSIYWPLCSAHPSQVTVTAVKEEKENESSIDNQQSLLPWTNLFSSIQQIFIMYLPCAGHSGSLWVDSSEQEKNVLYRLAILFLFCR